MGVADMERVLLGIEDVLVVVDRRIRSAGVRQFLQGMAHYSRGREGRQADSSNRFGQRFEECEFLTCRRSIIPAACILRRSVTKQDRSTLNQHAAPPVGRSFT